MTLNHCESDADFTSFLLKCGTTPVIVDFYADWYVFLNSALNNINVLRCGPCKQIAPFFKDLSLRYPQLKFAKVNVDTCTDARNKYAIRAMPTFLVLINGQKMDSLSGANSSGLEALAKKWSENIPSQHSCPIAGQMDLQTFLDRSNLECLNEDSDHNIRALFESGGVLQSDCDEQLIINIPFSQPVKIHSIQVGGPNGKAPKSVKIFANIPQTLDFDKAQSSEPIQTLDFEENALQGLKFVKFQNVKNLLLFVENNVEGGDVTAINELKLYGQPLSGSTNMEEFKRVAGKAGEVGH
ncbi:putative thioredoxin [Aphelenchoides bicaudatus]|nr:putative thioredoxin [Aphelenchoides bicaudatus]